MVLLTFREIQHLKSRKLNSLIYIESIMEVPSISSKKRKTDKVGESDDSANEEGEHAVNDDVVRNHGEFMAAVTFLKKVMPAIGFASTNYNILGKITERGFAFLHATAKYDHTLNVPYDATTGSITFYVEDSNAYYIIPEGEVVAFLACVQQVLGNDAAINQIIWPSELRKRTFTYEDPKTIGTFEDGLASFYKCNVRNIIYDRHMENKKYIVILDNKYVRAKDTHIGNGVLLKALFVRHAITIPNMGPFINLDCPTHYPVRFEGDDLDGGWGACVKKILYTK